VASFSRHFDRALEANVVELGRIRPDQSAFRTKYDPGNPAANDKGEVKLPNVNTLIETVDMREAQRSYEANLNLITATRRMISRTLEILRV
jgi:flagellar basal-body rod protein FlgC